MNQLSASAAKVSFKLVAEVTDQECPRTPVHDVGMSVQQLHTAKRLAAANMD